MPIDLNRVRLICFDVDGTLSDTDDQWVSRLSGMLRFLPRIFPQARSERLARRIVMGLESPGNFLFSIPDLFGLDDELARLVHWFNTHRPIRHGQPYPLVPGVAGLLDALGKRYPLMVVSARDEAGTLSFLDAHQLTGRFQAVITGQTCAHTKPFPDPILEAARRAGVSPAECLMVGDTTVDIIAARRAGAQSVGVLCGFGEEAELRRAGADEILPSTADLAAILTK
jgi:HAD superfamily hydrolase (TIGR01509 family)